MGGVNKEKVLKGCGTGSWRKREGIRQGYRHSKDEGKKTTERPGAALEKVFT